ncbi:hypothetical protein AUJ17_02155 [Candidatus Micrarchaeota archaeon CG1_02_47_40]|nr:MAG: hypothetical protein AUJ17_02155 [Candidatus Micrarchaeota archaeon CG1_02_47_40]
MNYLEKIIPQVKETVDSGYYVHASRERKSLVEKIEEEKEKKVVPLIAEIKPASPREGKIIGKEEMEEIAREYVEGGASALSILTEPKDFLGDILFLQREWKIPVLMKDFVIDKRQIGSGDAVLLIQKLLDLCHIEADELIDAAHEEGMETLLEVHDVYEFEKAKKTETDIIGINNRNLETMEIDLENTCKILKEVKSDRLVISESGISSAEDVRRLISAGADAVLVGTSLLKCKDRKGRIGEMRGAR